jgi:hypothetical protein
MTVCSFYEQVASRPRRHDFRTLKKKKKNFFLIDLMVEWAKLMSSHVEVAGSIPKFETLIDHLSHIGVSDLKNSFAIIREIFFRIF